MRYKIYLGNFEKKIAETENRTDAERLYLSAVREMMESKEYPIFIWDTKTKSKIT